MRTPRKLFLFTQYCFLAPRGCFWILALDPPPWAPGPLGLFLLSFCWSLLSFQTGPPACCCGPPVPAGGSLSAVNQGLLLKDSKPHIAKPGRWSCAGQSTGAAVREPWGQRTAEGPAGRGHGGGHEHLPGPCGLHAGEWSAEAAPGWGLPAAVTASGVRAVFSAFSEA